MEIKLMGLKSGDDVTVGELKLVSDGLKFSTLESLLPSVAEPVFVGNIAELYALTFEDNYYRMGYVEDIPQGYFIWCPEEKKWLHQMADHIKLKPLSMSLEFTHPNGWYIFVRSFPSELCPYVKKTEDGWVWHDGSLVDGLDQKRVIGPIDVSGFKGF